MKIRIVRDSETLRYAAEELAKYLRMMDSSVLAELSVGETCEDAINLGLLADYGLNADDVHDAMIDDVIDANVVNLKGYIAGSNERSVLMGVYNYLKSAGCNWVRPGPLGEYIPKCDPTVVSYRFRKKADYPFRGECIEGAVGYEHLRDTVYWLPKVNMNLFMIEQIVPYNYMHRWYRHVQNTRLPHDDIPYEQYCDYCLMLEHDIKKCGLQLHVMGHGALNEPFGVRHMISGQEYDIPEETKKAFALVKGQRELYKKSPFFTQVCMSQEWVQEKIVNWLADYLKQKPYIDFLHFWLADNINNHCECEDCIKHRPTDLYVQMLNRLDAKLTEQGNDTKIVFILYVDTLWPPIVEKLNNPSRFIMTTACGTGTKYSDKRREGGIPEWKRNDYAIQGGLDMTLTFVDGWKPAFDGMKFIYEYYLYTPHFGDPGYMTFSKRIAEDIKTLHVTGFDGIMSDQTQRAYFPTALPNAIIGEFLFDTTHDTTAFIEQYLSDAFGAEYAKAKEYLEAVSACFDIDALALKVDVTAQDTGSVDKKAQKSKIWGNRALGEVLSRVPALVDSYLPMIKQCAESADPCHAESWRILTYHVEYCKHISGIYVALAKDDAVLAEQLLDAAVDYLSEIEMEIHPYFDLVLFKQRFKRMIEGKKYS